MTLLIEDDSIVVPGELIAEGEYERGSGVVQEGDKFYASMVGVFFIKDDNLRVRPLKGRYIPKVGDKVIGFIKDVNLTSWIVNMRGPYDGVLLASNAIKGRFDPIKDDARRIYDVGDVVLAEVVSFDRTRDPMLSTNFPRLGKLSGGRVLEVSPNHIPRVIGKKGAMVNMIKNATNSKITVSQNGRIWIETEKKEDQDKVIEVIRRITREAHTSGLTDRIQAYLNEN
ncbi:MAG: exosome complex RNA-binding protein Rrp4 [Candidatus Kariarchaeaceae archaeon]|jgi:exosome complex component RRP4